MTQLSEHEIQRMKEEATHEIAKIVKQLEDDYPGVTEGLAAVLGAGTGVAGSLVALGALGTAGFSAAGITSGLATAGAVIGGGMLAGVAVLAAPVAILATGGFALAKKRKNAKHAAALSTAISKLYSVQERLSENAEYFKEHIAEIRATINLLNKNNIKIK